jgi:hemerythrin-like metal-binding protein
MALMTWSSRYSVGVETLDNQHKELLRVLNELHFASMRGKAQEVAGGLISQLVSIADEHFAAEERLMESIGFPALGEHRAKHKEMSGRVAEFVARHKKGDTTMYTQLLYFMRDWLSNHMLTVDSQYASWLASHGRH